MNALHSKATPEWYTPAEYVEAARAVMGGIDLDPASCFTAQQTVQAAAYYTKEDDGLVQPWRGNVFINPPGGLVRQFWRKALHEYVTGHVEQFIWIGYSLQQLQTLQTDGNGPLGLAQICVPRRRIAFINESGQPSKAPTHANYIAYIGPQTHAFSEVFRKFGELS